MAADSLPDNSGTLRISGRMSPQISPLTSGPDDRTIRAPEASVDPLTQQLAHERAQLNRAEVRIADLDVERRHLFELLLTDRRPWWRRWFP